MGGFRMGRRGFTAVELVVVIVVLVIVVTVTMIVVDRERQARLRADIKAVGEAINSRGFYPLLSPEAGQLAPRLEGFVWTTDRWGHVPPMLVDQYWFLGYSLPNEAAGLAFVDAYKKAIEERGKPPSEDVLKVRHYKLYNGSKRDWLTRLGFEGVIFGPDAEEVENKLKYAGILSITALTSPVFIERPGLQRGGSNVLFLDGTVEFIPYPGKWPMTEKFIAALESLDELKVKESIGDAPEK